LNDNLQERLKILQNKIDNYNIEIKNIIKQEKDYWKQLEQIIAKLVEKIIYLIKYLFYLNRRTNLHKTTTNKLTPLQISSNTRPIVVVNGTFVMHVDKNNENLPPSECTSPIKIPKIRKKKKCI
jgi:hypothetical protein